MLTILVVFACVAFVGLTLFFILLVAVLCVSKKIRRWRSTSYTARVARSQQVSTSL